MYDKRDPSTWIMLYGFHDALSVAENVQHIIASGANSIYFNVGIGSWGWNDLVCAGNTIGFTDYRKQLAIALKLAGIHIHIHCTPGSLDDSYADTATYMDALLLNTNGAQTSYINKFSQMITDLTPDSTQLVNEPFGHAANGYTTPYMTQYVALCNTLMSVANSINPGMAFTVMGFPFWNVTTITTKSFTIPPGTYLHLSFHAYYALYGYDADKLDTQYLAGNFAVGYSDWMTFLHTTLGLDNAWSNGWKLFWEECGSASYDGQRAVPPVSYVPAKNIQRWLRDMWSWCVEHKVGFNCFCNAGWSAIHNSSGTVTGSLPEAWKSGGIFNNDWSYNLAGEVFLEFSDSVINFAGRNWKIRKGTWIVT